MIYSVDYANVREIEELFESIKLELISRRGSRIDPEDVVSALRSLAAAGETPPLIPRPLDANMNFEELYLTLSGQEQIVIGLLWTHAWISCLADCEYATAEEIQILRGVGRGKRFSIIKRMLADAGVQLESKTAGRANWPTIGGRPTPPKKFESMTIARAVWLHNMAVPVTGAKIINTENGDWANLSRCNMTLIGELITIGTFPLADARLVNAAVIGMIPRSSIRNLSSLLKSIYEVLPLKF